MRTWLFWLPAALLALLINSCCCINDVVHDEEPEDQPMNWGAHGEGRAEDI